MCNTLIRAYDVGIAVDDATDLAAHTRDVDGAALGGRQGPPAREVRGREVARHDVVEEQRAELRGVVEQRLEGAGRELGEGGVGGGEDGERAGAVEGAGQPRRLHGRRERENPGVFAASPRMLLVATDAEPMYSFDDSKACVTCSGLAPRLNNWTKKAWPDGSGVRSRYRA